MTDLRKLAERVENGERSDQYAILVEAFEAIKGPRITQTKHGITRFHTDWFKFNRMLNCEAYESAAMSLVPEGKWATISTARPSAACISGAVTRWIYAATPALALVAAALRAIASEQEKG